jgi:uncharacterized protein YndB with AHSA1/START domain
MSTNKDDRRGELTVSRVVNAPRDLVWQAFTEPEHLAAFWGGPGITVPVESVAMDVCPGGSFELTMVAPDGADYPNRGEYVEVDKPGRIVFTEPDTGITARYPSRHQFHHRQISPQHRQNTYWRN